MWNDENTPMEFVCYLLETLFEMDAEKARQIMLDVHHRGVRVCGVYDRQQDAVAKAAAATKLAREHGHRLRVTYAYGNARMRITPMVYIPATDDDITAAIAKARATLPAFWASYEARKPAETGHHLKVRFPTPRDGLRRPLSEHIWISAVRRLANGSYSGRINSVPYYLPRKREGDLVEFEDADISDWMFARNGKIVGGETIKCLLKTMPKAEADALRARMETP
jgi:uncharacterized protein YegJ (DUF2314 family)